MALLLLLAGFAVGCRNLNRSSKKQTIYVVSRQTYLRDRVAPVAVHTAKVVNGEPLEVLQQVTRFYRVKTSQGVEGWIEDHFVIDQQTYQRFQQLRQQYEHSPALAKAVIHDELYMHLEPGRDSYRYYLLPANDRLELLARASAPRPNFVPVRIEDWWLARDTSGKVGWVLSRALDLDAPDQIVGYSEGQKMVAAYLLDHVHDPESRYPDGQVPEYVTVLNSYAQGLPYDFNQVRVFIWNTRRHRYETAFRKRNLEGYLPVIVTHESLGDKVERGASVPIFSVKVATDPGVIKDPQTGAAQPAASATLRYALEGNVVRLISPDTGVKPISPEPEKPVAPSRKRAPKKKRGGG